MAIISINLSDIAENYKKMREVCGPAAVFAFVKGNGYGVGTERFAAAVYGAGCRDFCAARHYDALALKRMFPDSRVLLCGFCPENKLAEIVSAGVIVTVEDAESVRRTAAAANGAEAEVSIAVDTGLGRLGMHMEEAQNIYEELYKNKNIRVVSTYSHFSNSFGGKKSKKSCVAQFRRFMETVEALRAAGVECGLLHIANSSSALMWPQFRMDAVRAGSALIGRCAGAASAGLVRVGSCKAMVSSVRTLKRGEKYGYLGVYTAKRTTKLAIIEAGHADALFISRAQDGFRLSDRLFYAKKDMLARPFTCRVNGQKAVIVGRVGLTNIAADVTNIDCKEGDKAEIEMNPLFLSTGRVDYIEDGEK